MTMVMAAGAVALVIGGTLTYRHLDKVTYEVMNGTIGPGGFVRPTAPGTSILFSEGSEITLGDSARARVENLTGDGGRVVVESGSVHARIVPLQRARWLVDAGPYTIRVTGTAFNVKWSWADERLDIQMDRGSVIVTGPLAPAGVTLTAGMSLVAHPGSGLTMGGGAGRGGVATVARVPSTSPSSSPVSSTSMKGAALDEALAAPLPAHALPAMNAVARPGDRARPATRQKPVFGSTDPAPRAVGATATATSTSTSPLDSLPSGHEPWDRQLARGNVNGILADAEAQGIDRVLMSVSGRELSALADAARYGHRPALARRVLLSVRDRFPRSAESREAAFFLGALAEDAAAVGTGGGVAAALDWYERYARESANGRYAAQALGRRMVITHRLKGMAAARPIAHEYLDRYPGGPYAPAARKLTRDP
ncbi:MAG: FecR domain-containing protein [Deltaproteobacteria bacterium]|nr:FecR domain-containing protein [Deltaproteobacteria bacterium]